MLAYNRKGAFSENRTFCNQKYPKFITFCSSTMKVCQINCYFSHRKWYKMQELFLVINSLVCQKNGQKQIVQFLSLNIIADRILFLFSYD